MRISKVAVRDYLSLKDSGEVSLSADITLLLGKNENGKTNLLLALQSFDRDAEYDEQDFCRYSETRTDLASGSVRREDIPVVTVWFVPEPSDRKKLKRVHRSLEPAGELSVTKYLSNHYSVEIDGRALEEFGQISQADRPSSIWAGMTTAVRSLADELRKASERHQPFGAAVPALEQAITGFADAPAEIAEDPSQAVQVLTAQLTGLPEQGR